MKYYLLLVISLCFGCNNSSVNISENILSETLFTNIIKEIHLAEAVFELQKNKNIKEAENQLKKSYQDIYNTYQISEEDFKETLSFYSNKPEKLEEIYTHVLEILNNENSKLDQQ